MSHHAENLADRSLLIGIDGGGTKTVALLADQNGHILGRGIGGPSNYQVTGIQAAGEAIQQAIRAAFAEAGLPPCLPRAICFGLSGVDRPEDHALMRAWADEHLPGIPVLIVNDAMLVLAAGTPEGWGIALISGTGSIVYGRAPDGRMARADGWGHLLGDEGSGYAIGLAALRAVMRAHDGRGPQTALTRSVLAHWSLAAPENLVHRVYIAQVAAHEIASLGALVEAAASEGDAVARDILREAGRQLALSAAAVARKLELPMPVPCAQAGSVIVKGQNVRQRFLDAARELGLQLDPVTPVTEPAQGALRLAVRLIADG